MLISKTHQKIVLNLRDPDRVTTVIPTAKKFMYKGVELVAVPHRNDETKVLRNLGFEVPAPIEYYYPWSGQYAPFKAQKVTSSFLTQNPSAFVLNDMGCVDAYTEYLSPTGWVQIGQYTGGEVAQYHPDTGCIEFVEPLEYVKKPCTDMFHIKTKYGVDQMLSPEHRVLLEARDGARREVLQAHELFRRQAEWLSGRQTKGAGKIGWTKAAMPVTFSAPGGSGLPLTDQQLRVQIAVIADGTFPRGTLRCCINVKKARKQDRLRQLLIDASIEFSERSAKPDGYRRFTFDAPMRAKAYGPEFWQATAQQLSIIADEVMHWDGSVSASKPTERFSTDDQASADFIQYAFAGTGRTARVAGMNRDVRGGRACNAVEWEVRVRADGKPLQVCSYRDGGKFATMTEVRSPDGFKYCFMVPSTFLLFRRNGCVFASGNTGKTLATLWAFDYLRTVGKASKALIISPLSTLERTWADEVFQHFPHLSVGVVYGAKARRQKILADDYDIYLINHDGIKTLEKELVERKDIDTIVVDEIASFRNASTNRWKALRKITQDRPRVWGLTGTPIPNLPTDAWAQCRLISPSRVPPYFGKFRDSVMKQLGPFKWVPRDNATEIVADAMQPSIRFRRDECVDLPPCQYVERSVPLTPEQAKAYKEMSAKLKMEFASQEVTAVNEAVKMQKLIQIACGVVYDSDGNDVILPNDHRIDVVREVIEESGTKTIVFVPYKGVLRHVAEQLSKDFTVEMISGDTPAHKRAEIFAAFQRTADPKVLVAQPAAMSHGLTLTAASTVIWYAPVTSNEVYLQANARITRPGQKHSQLIVNIESTHVEQRVYARLKNKQSMQGLLLETVKGS